MTGQLLTASAFESLFDSFVRDRTTGIRFNEAPEIAIPAGSKCADYWFQKERLAIELKTLNKNHGSREQVIGFVDEALRKSGYSIQLRDAWLQRRSPLPKKVVNAVNLKVQNSIKGSIRKANDQMRSTKQIVGEDIDTILVVANLNERLFGPLEMLKYISGHVLERRNPQIDAVALISPGVAYSTGNGRGKHYLQAVYAEGKENLGDFIEPILMKWIEYEAAHFGVIPIVEMSRELTEEDMTARPTKQ